MTDCLVFSSDYQKIFSRTAAIMLQRTQIKFFITYLAAKPLILVQNNSHPSRYWCKGTFLQAKFLTRNQHHNWKSAVVNLITGIENSLGSFYLIQLFNQIQFMSNPQLLSQQSLHLFTKYLQYSNTPVANLMPMKWTNLYHTNFSNFSPAPSAQQGFLTSLEKHLYNREPYMEGELFSHCFLKDAWVQRKWPNCTMVCASALFPESGKQGQPLLSREGSHCLL